MREQEPRRLLKASIVFLIMLLVVILLAEGVVLHNNSHPKTANAQPAGAAAQAPAPTTAPTASPCQFTAKKMASCFNGPAAANIIKGTIHLHVQTDGFGCEDSLVLNGIRAVYDQGTLQQMRKYADSFWGATTSGMGVIEKPYTLATAKKLPPIPGTLEVAPGGLGCHALFDITNMGARVIQISAMGLTLSKSLAQNSFAYKLVDMCTLPGFQCCQGCGSTPPCSYNAGIHLAANLAGSYREGTVVPEGDPDLCQNPSSALIQPGKLLEVEVDLMSSPANLIYSAIPSIIVGSGSSKTTLALPASFTSTLVFAADKQFSCYGYNGRAFVKEVTTYNSFWCV